ncbi:MAG TPA: hypothetical protein VL689_08545 [Paraburkholderia sp.]|jgi:hypothetical protein|nr:hypothetical protein [Paraburkholderia sp.]
MKASTFACAFVALFWISMRVHAQLQPAPQESYEYLRRLRVPDTVVNCVAALDRWVHHAPRYDSVLVPDRHVLNARIEANDGTIGATPVPAPASSATATAPATPFDSLIHMRGFAKVRGKYLWVPVKATCAVWHEQVVDVGLQPRVVR